MMRRVWILVLAGVLAHAAFAAAPMGVDWGRWMLERREGTYRDRPAELGRVAREMQAARQSQDDEAWALWAGYRLILLSAQGDASVDALAGEVAAVLERPPLQARPSAGRLSLLLGLGRFRQDNRDIPGLAKVLDEAQSVADQLGQPAMKAEVDAARALYRVYEGDAAGAEALAQRALSLTQDPLLRLELFQGPQAIARILSINTPDAAQGLLADMDTQLSTLDAEAFPYMAVNLGMMKAIVLRRVLQPVAAQEEVDRWLKFASARPGFQLGYGVQQLQGGLHQDLKNWAGCIDAVKPLTAPTYRVVARVDALITLVTCQARARSPDVTASLAELDRVTPLLAGSPGMVEAVLGAQARAYEALGDWQAAAQKLKAQRQATVARYAKANEVTRKQVETAYQVAAREKENAELKAQQALSEQRRTVLGVALVVAVLVLGIVAELLRRQSAQRRRLAELAHDLERVNHELSAANDQLNTLNASRTRLVAAACHDLRQPAHALGMLAEIASARAAGDDQHTLDAIRRSSTSLSELLDSLFDLSRLESDRYTPSIGPVSLGDLLDDLRTQFTVAALAKGLALRIDDVQATVRSDAHLLRRMVMNLLSNAIKYTGSGSVQISVTRRGAEWALSVQDTGPGIAPEQQEAAFSEYVRLDASRGSDGLGIGLAIVRRSAVLLGHRLTLESAVGRGSCFTLWLQAMDSTSPDEEAPVEASGAGQWIGLVDDDEQIRQAMCELLQLRGFHALAAASLEELQSAVGRAGRSAPDLLLSDLHLASSDSLDALAVLVGEGGVWAGVPAVLITGDLSTDVLARCQALGIIIAYKPLPARKLAQLIHKVLADAASRRPLTAPAATAR